MPGRGAVVLGMGSLGAGRLNAGSDLDLIVIYDAAGVETSTGPRPLAARLYYARLTQAMVTALTAQMAEGRLYEVDMRLRPSGRQGPVATSLESFRDLSDDRSLDMGASGPDPRPGAGRGAALGDEVEAFRREILRDKGTGAADCQPMWPTCARGWPPRSRAGPLGGQVRPGQDDGHRTAGADDGADVRQPGPQVERQIRGGRNGGPSVANGRDGVAGRLQAVLAIAGGTRLLTDRVVDPQALGDGARAFLLRETGEAAQRRWRRGWRRWPKAADAVIAEGAEEESDGTEEADPKGWCGKATRSRGSRRANAGRSLWTGR